MKIKDLKENNRPRERLISNGPASLSNEELLAILIAVGNRGESALELASRLINSINTLNELANLSYQELISLNGIKMSKASIILASFELAKRVYSTSNTSIKYDKPEEVYRLMFPIVSAEKVECFYALYLNIKCQLIEKRLITKGSVEKVIFDIKEVLRHGLKNACYSIILIHNHPSGDCNPSHADLDLTKKFIKAADLFNIIVLDHIIIGSKGYASLAGMNKLR